MCYPQMGQSAWTYIWVFHMGGRVGHLPQLSQAREQGVEQKGLEQVVQ